MWITLFNSISRSFKVIKNKNSFTGLARCALLIEMSSGMFLVIEKTSSFTTFMFITATSTNLFGAVYEHLLFLISDRTAAVSLKRQVTLLCSDSKSIAFTSSAVCSAVFYGPGAEAAAPLGGWASELRGAASPKLADMLISMTRSDLLQERWQTF